MTNFEYQPDGLWCLFTPEITSPYGNWIAVSGQFIPGSTATYNSSLYFQCSPSPYYNFQVQQGVPLLRVSGFESNYMKLLYSQSRDVKLSELGNKFSIQITLTFERFENYAGVLGLHNFTPGLLFCQYQNGQIYFNVEGTGTPISVLPEVFKKGAVNLAYVVDENTQSLYINGVLHQTTSAGNFISLTNEQAINLGFSFYEFGREMNGNVYDLAFYKKALSSTEVHSNYMLRSPSICPI